MIVLVVKIDQACKFCKYPSSLLLRLLMLITDGSLQKILKQRIELAIKRLAILDSIHPEAEYSFLGSINPETED